LTLLNTSTIKNNWKEAWYSSLTRIQLIAGVMIIIAILSFLPGFFKSIEQRDGITLNDPILASFTAIKVTWPIFVIMFAMAFLMLIRAVNEPKLFINYVWCLILINIVRIFTISVVPLDPPRGIIVLTDPITDAFYGESIITKDLFFSGHTGTILMMAFCFTDKFDKTLAYVASVLIGILVLVQHVHYTLDVLAAPFFIYPIYLFSKYILGLSFIGRWPLIIGQDGDRIREQ
jgi:hypothetical protein